MVERTSWVAQPRSYWFSEYDQYGNSSEMSLDFDPFIWPNSVLLGDSVPGYKQIIARGENASTVLSGSKYVVSSQGADVTCEGRNTNPIYTQNGEPPPLRHVRLVGNLLVASAPYDITYAHARLPEAENRARSKFYSHLGATQAAFQGAILGGELGESLRMIRHPVKRLRDSVDAYLDHLKRGSVIRTRRARVSFVRETWLEYSFGWAPLVNDASDALDAFLSSKWSRPIFQMVRGKGKDWTEDKSDPLYKDFGTGFKCTYTEKHKLSAEVKLYGVYHSKGAGPRDKISHYGFNRYEFVPTLWELIPYSFMVDYFTNVGEFLSAWSYRNIGCSWASRGTLAETSTIIDDAEMSYENLTSDPYNSGTISGSPGSSTLSLRQVNREPSTDIPLPNLALRCPGYGSLKWLNIAALSTKLHSTRRILNRYPG